MKKTTVVVSLLGVGLGIGLVVGLGAGKVAHAILAIGWAGFGILVGWQCLTIVVLAAAWLLLCTGGTLPRLVWGRLVREGGTNILPFSEVGGLAFAARAIVLTGIAWPRAIASSVADVAAEFIGEIPFIIFGFAVLLLHSPGSSLVLPLAIGVGFILAGVAALIWAERHTAQLIHALGRRIATRFLKQADDKADEIQDELNRLFGRPRRITAASGFHLLGWVAGGVTVWIAYRLLGSKIDVLSAMAIEGLLSAALAVAFLVPGGIGVQEASYVAIGRLFGMPAHVSLGLSLLRRARDIVIGAPALLSWQVIEARRLRQPEDVTGRADARSCPAGSASAMCRSRQARDT